MREDEDRHRWRARVLDTRHENPWFSVLEQRVDRPDGRSSTYFTIHHRTPAVGIVVRNDDRLLLLRQHRFIVNEFVWAIPSGGVEPDETPRQAAERELLEEAGMRATTLTHLLYYYPTYGCSDQRFELFLADAPHVGEPGVHDAEVIGRRWFSTDEVLRLIATNAIVDGLSLVPLLYVLSGLHVTQRTG
jgi:ADP-ribose pyrophosphatase